MAKGGFKFQMWMLGLLIIPIGIGISIVNVMQKGTVALGGDCTQNDDCSGGAQCIEVDGRSMCSTQCMAGSSLGCPATFACASVDMSVGGNSVPMQWCMPAP